MQAIGVRLHAVAGGDIGACFGAVAQLGERQNRTLEAVGSIPISSTETPVFSAPCSFVVGMKIAWVMKFCESLPTRTATPPLPPAP